MPRKVTKAPVIPCDSTPPHQELFTWPPTREMNKPGQLTAMISSTAADLPEHRKQVAEACLREGIFPIGMEQLPARDVSSIQVSLEMVDKADIYIGIYAWRYGWVPDFDNPEQISVTEMEFNRALERKQRGELKEILIFLMDEDHPIRARDKEDGTEAQAKLKSFKGRASTGRARLTFRSAEELRGHVIQSLADVNRRIASTAGGTPPVPDFHPPSIIPKPPEPYIAHPYSLLQTKDVVGRKDELNVLTDWVTTNQQVPVDTRIFTLAAIGGMGKSALAWKWFNDIAPNEMPKLAGRMWWSFYESNAYYDNLIIRALAYVSGNPENAVREMTSSDREDQLCLILDRQSFVIVLDGLERVLLAYAGMDAAQMRDDDLDQETASHVLKAHELPDSAVESFIGKHKLRCAADYRVGQFLRRLARVNATRILITTRLYPAELQRETGDPLPSCFASFLTGLRDDDALSLWREFKVSGSREQLVPLFRSFGNYPLLVRALAGEVANNRNKPRDFDEWQKRHQKFNPAALPLKNAKTHVLTYALRGLGDAQRKVLHTLAAFRMPTTWDTLRALLVQTGHGPQATSTHRDPGMMTRAGGKTAKPCADDRALDAVLSELEDRGLMGWDKRANRYDLHPVVRGVVWTTLADEAKHSLYSELHSYFEAIPKAVDWHRVEKLEDLTPALELYNALVGLGRFEKAYEVFFKHLDSATDYRFSASDLRIELLKPLVEITDSGDPQAGDPAALLSVLHALGRACLFAGRPREAAGYFLDGVHLSEQSPLLAGPDPSCLGELSSALRAIGDLRESQRAASIALLDRRKYKMPFEEATEAVRLGLILAASGQRNPSFAAFQRAMRIARLRGHVQFEGFVCGAIAQSELWFTRPPVAREFADRALSLARSFAYERDITRTARLAGVVALHQSDMRSALDCLHDALNRARKISFYEEEIPTLTALAELHRQRMEHNAARDLLENVWPLAERGPYPLLYADALNVLAQIERDQGNRGPAIAAATKACTLAWCTGPPHAYHYGLTNARKQLKELRAPEPELSPFDKSEVESMPDVDFNPKDEFWAAPRNETRGLD